MFATSSRSTSMKTIRSINCYSVAPIRSCALIAAVLFSLLLSACSSFNSAQKSASQVTLEDFQGVIGKTENSEEVLNIEKKTGLKPKRLVFDDSGTAYLVWHELGVEVLIENTKVRTVFLNSERKKLQYKAFPGKLPLGLQFSDARRDVEKKLGPPDEIDGGEVIEVWVTYRKPKLSVFYKSENLNDMDTTIEYICIQ